MKKPFNYKQFTYLSAAVLALSGTLQLRAQVSSSPQRFDPQATGYMERARAMLDAGNYAGVIDQLKFLQTGNVNFSLLDMLEPGAEQEAIYMLAESLYQRGDSECIRLLSDFVTRFPASPYSLNARLLIADFYFFNSDWKNVLEVLDNVDFNRLNRTQLPLYKYRKALALIKTGEENSARPLIKSLANFPEYRNAALFYEAFLDYNSGNFDKAYNSFLQVTPDKEGITPQYYLAQIDFSRGQYEKVISEGNDLLKNNPAEELIPETERIVGLSYFKIGNQTKAKSLLDSYMKSNPAKPSDEAVYALGVVDYDSGDYDSAVQRFSRLSDLESDLGQSAWLYIGQCDLKKGNPDAAAMAFEKAAKMNYDKKVSETALYNYVAALTRGGKIPFSSSADIMERFIADYPQSSYTPKIEEYLASAYYNDRNYSKALKSINAIKRPSSQVLAAKQKILYELGMECVINGEPTQGATYLRQAIELGSHNREIAAQAQLWLGDALYSLADFRGAGTAYKKAAESLKPSSNRTLALYDNAYVAYMMNDYGAAARAFATALAASPSLPKSLKDDAMIRRADCLYYTGNYSEARNLYAEAIRNEAADADYASYRHAIMLGLANDLKGKIRELSEIESKYPGSSWIPNARLEEALTYENIGQSRKAADAFRDLSKKYPDAVQARKALLNLALNDARAGRKQDAADSYKEIIRRWPSSDEAGIANDDLKKYYASIGELNEYAAFLAGVPGAGRLDAGEMEQLAFEGAEIAYTDNPKEITLLKKYVSDYPDGKYLAQALLDIAYSQQSQGRNAEAEETLSSLLVSRPHSPQAPEALLMKAEILEKTPGRTKDALLAYRQLENTASQDFGAEAASGIMRTTDSATERLEYARKSQLRGGLPAEQLEEASLIEAEALLTLGRASEAVPILKTLASNPAGEPGAKAAVTLAQYYLNSKQLDLAENTALDFTDNGTPHEFWLAKGYIVLADTYRAKGNTLLAKEYIRSLSENYPGNEPEIKNAISSRLKSWK